jgi:hypothetical protein
LLDCQSVPVCRTRNAHPGVSYGIHGGASYHPLAEVACHLGYDTMH